MHVNLIHKDIGHYIHLTGDEVAEAIDAYLAARGVHVRGPRTVRVNGALCRYGGVSVDPSGSVVYDGERSSRSDVASREEHDRMPSYHY